jgi:hypothetical protein
MAKKKVATKDEREHMSKVAQFRVLTCVKDQLTCHHIRPIWELERVILVSAEDQAIIEYHSTYATDHHHWTISVFIIANNNLKLCMELKKKCYTMLLKK